MINESVISTRNDPDYMQLTKSPFEINKHYIELITKYLIRDEKENGRRQSMNDEITIKNDAANYQITRSSLERLQPRKWLNDEIINAYISLVNLRPS